jgi:hypothetical protein
MEENNHFKASRDGCATGIWKTARVVGRNLKTRIAAATLAQPDDENNSPPVEGTAEGQGWVWSGESFA